ncbi:MAG: S8 family serine peptidase [Gammaproteobacteria bacterium]
MMKRISSHWAGTMLVAVLSGSISLAARAAPPTYVDGVVLVGYQAGAPAVARATARAVVGVQSVEPLSRSDRNSEKLKFKAGTNIDAVIKQLLRDPNVRYAHPDYHIKRMLSPNDPSFTNGTLWGMLGDASSPANAFGSQAAEVWAEGFVGSQQVVVGVIDGGMQVLHPDLQDNIWKNPVEAVGTPGVDDDSNGYVDDINGWDFFSNNASVYDGLDDDHGTHVAGTIGGKGNNGLGVVGVNWDVTIISAKFLGPTGGSTSDAVRAIDYLTDLKRRHGLNLVATNNSWGGGGYSQALLDAINRGGDAGILFIAAASNDALNNDTTANYPSNYQCTTASRSWDCLVAVASITSTGALSSFSNYGATTVDLGAPGSAITSTVPDSTYASFNGTSMATPHVTGAVALCASVDQTLSAQELRAAVVGTTAPTASLAGRTVTGGRLDAGAMFPVCRPPTAGVTGAPSTLQGAASGSKAIRLTWTDGVTGETYYQVEQGDATCSTFVAVAELGAGAASYTATGLQPDTQYCFRVRAGNRFPSVSAYSNTVTVATAAAPQPYQCRVEPYTWQDTTGGTALVLADDAETAVAMPFAWSYHGFPVTSIKVGSNGFIRLDGGSALEYLNAGIPSAVQPNAFIAPFWDDLNPGAAGAAIRTRLVSTGTPRRFVVSWEAVPHFSATTNPFSFQVVFEEGSSDVVMNYRDVLAGNTAYDRGMTATVGLEAQDGEFGTQVSFNNRSLSDGTALRCVTAPAATAAPLAPTTATATATTSTSATVSWSNVANETGYTLERATGAGAYGVIATLAADATSYVDTQVTTGTTYNYRLRASNAAGSSVAYSPVASVSMGSLPAPTGLATSNITATSITVSWGAVTGASNYTLEWSTNLAGPWTALAAQTTRTFNHTGRANSTTYHYRVRANVTGGSSSPYAGPVSATTLSAVPTVPNTVRVTRSGNSVTVTWADRSNNETGFEIGRQTRVGTTWQAIVPGIGNVGANVATFTHTVTAGTYRYVVRAKTATNQSAWSGASASITVP